MSVKLPKKRRTVPKLARATAPVPRLTAPVPHRSKHQERTEATQAKLLRAAEGIFTRDGFANAKLEQIAEHAGYTRGAIYAHYRSKEDLFLALFEQRLKAKLMRLRHLLERSSNTEENLRHFRQMIEEIALDRSWAILVLEFKLFALRQPKLKARLRKIREMLHTTSGVDFLQLLFGSMKAGEERRMERRCALIGPMVSAAVLESHFQPDLLSGRDLEEVLGEFFDAVIRL